MQYGCVRNCIGSNFGASFNTPDRSRALQQVRRVLKPGGILAVTEWLPDPDYPWKSTTIKMGREAGLVLDEAPGNIWHYTVRFRKP